MELPQLIVIKGLNIDITQYRNMCINVYYIYTYTYQIGELKQMEQPN